MNRKECWVCGKLIIEKKKNSNLTFCKKPTPYFLCNICTPKFKKLISCNNDRKHPVFEYTKTMKYQREMKYTCERCGKDISKYQHLNYRQCVFCAKIIITRENE